MGRTSHSGSAYSISSHDEAIIHQIKAKHGLKSREFNFKPLMLVVEDIFHQVFVSVGKQKSSEEAGNKEPGCSNPIEKLELQNHIRCTIHRLAWEITCKCAHRNDAHETTLALLDLLHDYSWEAKVVLILGTFAMTYGEFWLTAQPLPGNPLLQAVSMLKQPPCFQQTKSATLNSRFESLQNLVERMLDLANYIVELKEHKVYLDEISKTAVQLAAYLIIVSVVTCISSNMALAKLGTEIPFYGNRYTSLDTEIRVLNKFHHMLTPVHDYLHELYTAEKGRMSTGKVTREKEHTVQRVRQETVLQGATVLASRTRGKLESPHLDHSSFYNVIT
ncbi:hypothetical protein NE237_026062 [Protea cynaroides]|uniref:Sieve element occlusion N-terminal domain-containing protein n=1 Tax=Protea cynaroides TaxID=273540 RepID=A0A9Q0K0U0_9MAGN|nr:hypothetical protein NE237_026062 [Protea cynaroides]